jgi:peptide/nickel transport system substrate-binding protein
MTSMLVRAALAAVVAGAATLAALPAAAQEKTIRVRYNADIRSTDPGVNRDENTDAVVQHMVEGLVAFRENASVGPLLAESMTVSDDARTYTFVLREGLGFHNGAKLAAEDVLWTWKRYMDAKTGFRCTGDFDGRGLTKVTDISARDARTVVFTLEKPSALFPAIMARPDCGGTAVYHRDSVDAEGKWKAPIGTGPFQLGEWKRGEFIELRRFADYRSRPGPRDGLTGGKQPMVDGVRFVIIPDSAAARAALLSGSVDVLPDVSSADAIELRKRRDVTLSESQTMGMSAILMQTRAPVLRELKVRQAVIAALDVPELVAALTEGLGKPNASPIPVASAWHKGPHKDVPKQDVALAKRLLAEAGYRGEKIVMIANKRYPSMFDAAVLAQSMMQAAGLNVEIEVLDWATQLDRYSKGEYQMMSFGYSARLDPALSFEMVSGVKDRQPRKVWDSAEGEALIQQAMVVTDPAMRQALLDDLFLRFRADAPMAVLYNGVDSSAVRRPVRGYASWVMGTARLWGVALD